MRSSTNAIFTLLICVLFISSCGGVSDPDADVTVSDPCADYVGQATAAEIAFTPRANEEAEMLIIEMTGQMVASQELYDRTVRDLAQIRTIYPYTSHVTHQSDWGPHSLFVQLDADGYNSYQNQEYTAWDCPNGLYGLFYIQPFSTPGLFNLGFPAVLDMDALANEYAQLPNVTYANPNYAYGDGPDICMQSSGDDLVYVFDDATGSDCSSGCSDHLYSVYIVAPNGIITADVQQIPIVLSDSYIESCLPNL